MTSDTMRDDGWVLAPLLDTDLDEVMTWFPDAASVDRWGGPKFRYPFTPDTFREDCRFHLMKSCWVLRNPEGQLAAFGQAYERAGRGHLARIVANPALRRQGAGRRLIEGVLAKLDEVETYDEYSLFVYRDNTPAFECYRSLGFEVQEYPDDAPMAQQCYFLTRSAG